MLAGDRIISARNAFVMIHDAMTGTYGNAGTHIDAAALLEKVSDNIADMYAERAGEDTAYWRALMVEKGEDGTWYTGQEALAAGLVDELTAVPDDFDEDVAVADRLGVWSALLPAKAREFISDHPVEDDDDEDDDDEDDPEEQETEEATEDAADDMAWAMLAALTR
jgi:ClpP class serine protease